jgi:hypothetical protein
MKQQTSPTSWKILISLASRIGKPTLQQNSYRDRILKIAADNSADYTKHN